jgi:hypothetical protein
MVTQKEMALLLVNFCRGEYTYKQEKRQFGLYIRRDEHTHTNILSELMPLI